MLDRDAPDRCIDSQGCRGAATERLRLALRRISKTPAMGGDLLEVVWAIRDIADAALDSLDAQSRATPTPSAATKGKTLGEIAHDIFSQLGLKVWPDGSHHAWLTGLLAEVDENAGKRELAIDAIKRERATPSSRVADDADRAFYERVRHATILECALACDEEAEAQGSSDQPAAEREAGNWAAKRCAGIVRALLKGRVTR